MEALLTKMKEYLEMDTEIPYGEFNEYYQQVMGYLQASYDKMENEDLFKAKYILSIVSSNAAGRAQRKGPESKKYNKISEKTSFWGKAISYRLEKSGLSSKEIDEAVEKISQDGPKSENSR